MKITASLLAASAVLASLATGSASAAVVYGGFTGDTVVYNEVKEDDQGLFGAPTISGDSLVFAPAGFRAEAQDGAFDFTDGNLIVDVSAQDGEAIQQFRLAESGAFDLVAATAAGTDITRVEVAVVYSVSILEVDGAPSPDASPFGAAVTLLSRDLVASPGLGQSWSAAATIDIAGLAASELGITGDITRAIVGIDNKLLAVSEDGTLAFVDKKVVDGVTLTVPEPSTALLAVGGLCFFASRRIRG